MNELEKLQSEAKELSILKVGYYKGEMDFGINGSIEDLSYEQMNEFRAMTVAAIGTAEDMWRRANEAKSVQSVNF